jgi:hypothetical protein
MTFDFHNGIFFSRLLQTTGVVMGGGGSGGNLSSITRPDGRFKLNANKYPDSRYLDALYGRFKFDANKDPDSRYLDALSPMTGW